jgi:hypothetical protein
VPRIDGDITLVGGVFVDLEGKGVARIFVDASISLVRALIRLGVLTFFLILLPLAITGDWDLVNSVSVFLFGFRARRVIYLTPGASPFKRDERRVEGMCPSIYLEF